MEDIFKNRLNNYEKTPPDYLFDKINSKVKYNNKQGLKWYAIAGAAVMLIAVVSAIFINKNIDSETNKIKNNLTEKINSTTTTKYTGNSQKRESTTVSNRIQNNTTDTKVKENKQINNKQTVLKNKPKTIENKTIANNEQTRNIVNINKRIDVCGFNVDLKSKSFEIISGNAEIKNNRLTTKTEGTVSLRKEQNDTVFNISVVFHKTVKNDVLLKKYYDCSTGNCLVMLETQGDYTYIWNKGKKEDKDFKQLAPGSYILTVESNYCKDTFNVFIAEKNIVADFYHSELYLEPGYPIYFRTYDSANEKLSFKWEFDDGTYSTDKNPEHTFKKAGKYNVKLIVSNSTCTDSVEKQIVIEENQVKMPNIFTPNGDGQNDKFYLYPKELTDFEAVIFDKNGKLVYKTNNPDSPWTGKLSTGDDAVEGTYYYVIKGKDKDGNNFQYKSFVRLSR